VQSGGVEFEPGKDVVVTDDQAEQILRSRAFVDAKSGKNPNFVCKVCQRETFDDAVFDSLLARGNGSPLRSLLVDGGRICAACPQPQKPAPFVYVAQVEKPKADEPKPAD
jgi:hypothetical protein